MIRFGMALMEVVEQLTKGFIKATGRQPDNLEKLKIQQEAVQRFKDMNKVVDMEGNVIDTSKGIMGGKQIQDSPEFGSKIKKTYDEAKGPGKGQEMVDALKSPGAKKSYKIMEEQLGVKLYGDETFEEIMEIQKTGKHPRGEPKAQGGRIGYASGTQFELPFGKPDYFTGKGKNRRGIYIQKDGTRLVVPIGPDDLPSYAQGGRIGYKIGSIDKARRAFLKTAASIGGGIAALKTGLLSIGKGAAGKKAVEQVVTTPPVPGKPEWFDTLVNKVILEGEDVTKQFGYKERMKVHTKPISETEEVTVYRDLDDGSVRVNYGKKLKIDDTKPYERGNIGRATNDPDQIDLIVRESQVIEPDLTTGKGGGKTKASFEASEAEPRAAGGPEDVDIEFDGIREVDNVDDLMQDVSSLEEFATGKKLTGDKAAKAKKKREDFQRFTEDPVEQANYLEEKYGPYDDSAMDDFSSGGIARMLGE